MEGEDEKTKIIPRSKLGKPHVEGKDKTAQDGPEKEKILQGTDEEKSLSDEIPNGNSPPKATRDLVAYWLLGFCNNFTYWVMITAAYDLISEQLPSRKPLQVVTRSDDTFGSYDVTERADDVNYTALMPSNVFECQRHSTGAILVADTLPATILTVASPLTHMLAVTMRVWFVFLLCIASYLTLGLAPSSLVFAGVALTSASRGFSDSAFLSHASLFHRDVLSLWSSGTGVATFVGPLLYSGLTTLGLGPRHVLLSFVAVPLVIVMSFWGILSKPMKKSESFLADDKDSVTPTKELTGKEKRRLYLKALRYNLPLSTFYFIMYFTNQGLLELVYFPQSALTHAQQYSWSNTLRCLGTLISRSAHRLLLLPNSWMYNALALGILITIGVEILWKPLPGEYMIFILMLLQGLLEGAAFRHTMFTFHSKTSDREQAFCLGVFPVSLFFPAVLAGFAAMPAHDYLCSLQEGYNTAGNT